MTKFESGFALMRKRMVEDQLVAGGIADHRVLQAFLKVPRHVFVPDELRDRSYNPSPLEIAAEQSISQPYVVAKMLELLQLKPEDVVLDIGTGSGYQAALLAEIVETVVSIERIELLHQQAEEVLSGLGYDNIILIHGDGKMASSSLASYDAIIAAAAGNAIPAAWKAQLKDGGRMILPVKMDDQGQELMLVTRQGDEFIEESQGRVVFVDLW